MYRHFAPVCAGLMLIYLILTLKYGLMFLSGGSYARLSTLDAVFFCILAVLVFSVCFALTGLLPTDAQTTMFRWSKNINTIYCIHWVFLGILKTAKQLLWPDIVLPFCLGTVIAAVLLLASDNLAKFYKNKL